MSYILEALKKSEQERQQQQAPNLQTIQRSHLFHRGSHRSQQYILVALTAFLIVTVTFFVMPSTIFDSIVNALNKALPVVSSQTESIYDSVVDASPIEAKVKLVESALVDPVLLEPILVEYWELPDPVKKKIPVMTFSFHVYSDNAERRTIIINGRRVKEGAVVLPDLVLEEVTREGVVFNWRGQYRFSIDVVSQW